MFRFLSKGIYFQAYEVGNAGTFPSLPKYIVAVVPHTSWLDFLWAYWFAVFLENPSILLGKRNCSAP